MPKKVFTNDDITRLNEKSMVNKKAPKESSIVKAGGDRLVVSNKAEIQTEISFKADREYYSRASFENTFDTEISQLVTKAPPVEPDPAPNPPPAPTDVRIRCTNAHWTLDGKKGRSEKDQPSWHHNHHPLGNNPGGGALVIPDDHPLFYLRTCEPANARRTFNYEWKIGGVVVGHDPYYHMFNCSDQEPEDGKWREAPDIVVEIRVWNSQGEKTAKMKYRCARQIGDSDHLEDDGTPKPRWKWAGTRYYKEEEFYKGGWRVLTEPELDEKYKPRNVHISKITFEDYDKWSWTKASKWAFKPWSDRQLLPLIERPDPESRVQSEKLLHAHHSANWKLWRDKNASIFHTGRYNPWNRHPKAFWGEIYINGDWQTFGEIWDGFENDAGLKAPPSNKPDRYDARNFMRLDEDGKPAKVSSWTKKGDKVGTTAMQRLKKPIKTSVPIGEKIMVAFKYGYRRSGPNNKNLEYIMFSGYKTHTVNENDGKNVWLNIKVKATLIKYDNNIYDFDTIDDAKADEAKAASNKFTKSTAQESKDKKYVKDIKKRKN